MSFTTELKDAAGRPITEGRAVTIDAYSGSIYTMETYVVGVKGKCTVLLLSDEDALEEFKRTGSLEGLPVGQKKHTRIVMCNLKD